MNEQPETQEPLNEEPLNEGARTMRRRFGRPIAEILDDLHKPVPDRLLRTYDKPTKTGSIPITYIPWYEVARMLDFYAPGWELEVVEKKVVAGRGKDAGEFLITCRLWIHAEEGRFCRESTGFESLDKTGFGDYQSNAEAMALRRAAARWGLGAHLYYKDDEPHAPARPAKQSPQQAQRQAQKQKHRQLAKKKPAPEKPTPADDPLSPGRASQAMYEPDAGEAGIGGFSDWIERAEKTLARLKTVNPAEVADAIDAARVDMERYPVATIKASALGRLDKFSDEVARRGQLLRAFRNRIQQALEEDYYDELVAEYEPTVRLWSEVWIEYTQSMVRQCLTKYGVDLEDANEPIRAPATSPHAPDDSLPLFDAATDDLPA